MIQRVTGRWPIFARPVAPVNKYFVSGSIIEYARERCLVWGSGILSRADRFARGAVFLAVRGPLTRQVILAQGADCPAVYGDPALLLPRFYQPPPAPRRGIGLVPHFSDQPKISACTFDPQRIFPVSVQQRVESFINHLCLREYVASSSLHGIIISHAYGIPAAWIKFGDLPSGDDSKFYDYFASVGMTGVQPLQVYPSGIQAEALLKNARLPSALPDLDQLWEHCPFR